MLFNSYEFIFGFLPVVLLGFHILGERHRDWALLWLTAASLFFYAWWRPVNVLLIAPSILINFGLARLLERYREPRPTLARTVLICGIVFNLCFLGYFKYTMFLRDTVNGIFGTDFVLTQIILPLGISFITLQMIAFLADVRARRVTSFTFRDHMLFVLFFPRLIAGPIVRYQEMMPPFRTVPARFNAEDASVGVTLFFMGLAKKLLLADPLAPIVTPFYAQATNGGGLGLVDGWIAALGFLLQIYFDFSGYSDMALGLARFFGIKFPVNFNSPLKASSIIDYWLRWHASLTQFMIVYIYNPMVPWPTRAWIAEGGQRPGGHDMTAASFIRLLMVPTIITMVVLGAWHGAGYTFIVFGLMHGMYVTINLAWRQFGPGTTSRKPAMKPIGWILTFLSVVFAIVMFRAPTVHAAISIWTDMLGGHGLALPEGLLARFGPAAGWLRAIGVHPDASSGALLVEATLRITVLLAIVLFLPNTLEILSNHEPAMGFSPTIRESWLSRHIKWTPSGPWAVGVATVAAAGILALSEFSKFLYWQF